MNQESIYKEALNNGWKDWFKDPPVSDKRRVIVVIIEEAYTNNTADYRYELWNVKQGERFNYEPDYAEKPILWKEIEQVNFKCEVEYHSNVNNEGAYMR